MDPTLTMLRRVLAAVNLHAELTATTFDENTLAAVAKDHTNRIDWIRLRSLADAAALSADRAVQVIGPCPPRTGDKRVDNLLAAIAERIAANHHIATPAWCRTVPPLEEPWEHDGTPAMRTRRRRSTPPELAARNIWLEHDAIWRRSHDSTTAA